MNSIIQERSAQSKQKYARFVCLIMHVDFDQQKWQESVVKTMSVAPYTKSKSKSN